LVQLRRHNPCLDYSWVSQNHYSNFEKKKVAL
jgi:hypothetical protein